MPLDPYHRWLGIRPSGRISHYRLLGLDPFEDDPQVIAHAADRQMSHVRGFQNGPHGEASQRLLAEIAAARVCLLDAGRKTAYDEQLAAEMLRDGISPGADGAAFDEFLLLDEIAAASASTIFKARHRTMQRLVALQILTATAAADPREVERFRRKAAILAKLQHPHVITAYDAGTRNGVHCLVMELVGGESLHVLMRRGVPPADAVAWAKQAAAGLGHAHARGVIHRRVTPSNLLADPQHGIKIAGFGLALLSGAADQAPEAPGASVGNVDYVAPEQVEDSRRVDPRADVYGLGCTLAALLRGRPPYTGSTSDKVHQHRSAAPPRLTAVAGVDAELERIVHGMMAKAPDDRPASMYAVIESLQGWLFSRRQTASA